MSLLKKLGRGLETVAKAAISRSPVGSLALGVGQALLTRPAPRPSTGTVALPGAGPVRIPGTGGPVGRPTGTRSPGGAATEVILGGGGTIIGGWLYDKFGNKVKRMTRPRAKGITGRELKAFKRVNGILDAYCKVKPPTRSRSTPRRSARKCR